MTGLDWICLAMTHVLQNVLAFHFFFSDKRYEIHVTKTSIHTIMTGPWASYQIRKIAGCACAGNAGNVFPRRRFQRKPLVSDPDMHHGTCVTHVPWCMSGSLTCGNGENVPGIPGACAPGILRIWQEAHVQLSPIPTRLTSHYKITISHHIVDLLMAW